MSAEISLQVVCKVCGQTFIVPFTPNEYITERFIRATAVCGLHKPGNSPQRRSPKRILSSVARLPHPND